MNIDLIAGARPNFMKIAPIVHAIHDSIKYKEGDLKYRLIHTGQHYDQNMSGQFFDELNIPAPDINLGSGSGTQAEQTAKIMVAYEKLLIEDPTDLCLVVGDVTSTMACSIVAKKMHLKVAHVEAGIRSGDEQMPEEINRIVTDSITDYFFTTSETANQKLKSLGVDIDSIFFVGNTMIDTLLAQRPNFKPPPVYEEVGLVKQNYFVVTLHRPNNVDEENTFVTLFKAILRGSRGLPIIFPVHPRTRKILDQLSVDFENVHFTDPLGYHEFNYLVEHAKGVITDSGGITEETTVMNVPCITVRDSTERPETVTMGTNELVGYDPKRIEKAFDKLFSGQWKEGSIPPLWDGRAAQRIVDVLLKLAVQ